MSDDIFDWRNDEHVIVREQEALACYPNQHGQIVILREARFDEEDDVAVIVSREYALLVAHSILRVAGMGDIEFIRRCGGGYEDVPIWPEVAAELHSDKEAHSEPKPKDPTGAERQRRHRNKHRNGNGRDVTVELEALPLLLRPPQTRFIEISEAKAARIPQVIMTYAQNFEDVILGWPGSRCAQRGCSGPC